MNDPSKLIILTVIGAIVSIVVVKLGIVDYIDKLIFP